MADSLQAGRLGALATDGVGGVLRVCNGRRKGSRFRTGMHKSGEMLANGGRPVEPGNQVRNHDFHFVVAGVRLQLNLV